MSKLYGKGGSQNSSPVYGAGGIPSGSPVYGAGGSYNASPVYSGSIFPSELPDLKLWCRYGYGITVTGSGVSKWEDVSGNDNHLLQATDASRPSLQPDGSILFDGIGNFLKANAFALNQPETVYLLFKQVTWTLSDGIFDGNTDLSMLLNSVSPTPTLSLFAGLANTPTTALATVGDYVGLSAVFNGASSVIQVGNETSATGNPGASNAGGFTLGRRAGAQFSNIQVKEVAIFNAAHDEKQRTEIIKFLENTGLD